MPRYFFHVREGDVLLPDDDEGQELQSVKEAQQEAIQTARELLSEAALAGRAASLNYQIEVVDEGGVTVFVMPVGRVTGTNSQA